MLSRIPWVQILKVAAPIILVICVLWGIYSIGYGNGKKHVQTEWDKDKIIQQNEMIRIKDENSKKEAFHSINSVRISDELSQTKDQLAIALNNLASERTSRMQLSAERSKIYKQLGEASTPQCSYLASHAAKLDASLEEGRGLVKEFRATLGQRENELRLLGDQILSDRELMESDNGSSKSGISAR